VNDINKTRERLKNIIESSGYSLRRFSSEIGITPGGLSGILSGRSKILSGMFLKVLEYRFNVNPVWLETGEGATYIKKFLIEDADEIEHVIKLRKLDKEQKKSVIVMTNALYQQKLHDEGGDLMVAEPSRKKFKKWN